MDVVELHQRTSEEFVRRVRAVRSDQWRQPTPCTEWDVRAVVNHVVGEERWTVPLMAGATIEEVGDRFDGDLLGDDPIGITEHAARAAEASVLSPVLEGRMVHLSYGDESAAEYAMQLAADHLIHAWDVAVATDGDAALDPELIGAVADWFAEREELYRQGGSIADRPQTALDDDAQARLLAAFGRDRRWSPVLGVLDRFNAATAAGNVDAMMELMVDDCVFESTEPAPDGRRVEGAAAVRAEWERLFAGTIEPRFETEEMFACGPQGVVRWRYSWRNSDGSPGHVRGVDVVRLRDGKIAEKLSYVKG